MGSRSFWRRADVTKRDNADDDYTPFRASPSAASTAAVDALPRGPAASRFDRVPKASCTARRAAGTASGVSRLIKSSAMSAASSATAARVASRTFIAIFPVMVSAAAAATASGSRSHDPPAFRSVVPRTSATTARASSTATRPNRSTTSRATSSATASAIATDTVSRSLGSAGSTACFAALVAAVTIRTGFRNRGRRPPINGPPPPNRTQQASEFHRSTGATTDALTCS